MWKTVFLTLILLIASVLLIAETTFATPWMEGNSWLAENTVNAVSPEVTPSPELPQAKVDESQSNQQTADSKTENENSTPEKQSAVNSVRPQAANPYDMEAIAKYNQENYGAGN
ncbi:hypothetical protein NIES2100_60070 [Calothrix sp. NIES-2100]|uniref:hypothetical protein n=1 Tax=Calothrix sp. NIES-2100 TaxID=1954172 RepID=UPI000B5E7208|nr:hypothetical protein NIES2100_60070 [Calothrix sp. NIES-2100]